MAGAFVQKVGLNQVSAGSPVVTVPAAGCKLGNHLVAVYATNGATALTVVGVSDSKGNTWQDDRVQADTVGVVHVGIASCKITKELVSGDTITVTPTGGGANRTLDVIEVSGLAQTSWRDVVNGAGATSTAPSSGNLVSTAAGGFLVGGCGYNVAAGGYAPGATGGGTPVEVDDVAVGGQAAKSMESMYLVLSGAGTYVAAGTITSAAWVQAGVVYKTEPPTAFPLNATVRDTFTRTVATPLDAPWNANRVQGGGTNGLSANGTQVLVTVAGGNGFLTPEEWASQEAFVDVAVLPAANGYVALYMRLTNTNNANWVGVYLIWTAVTGAANDTWKLMRKPAGGAAVQLGLTVTGPDLAAGDAIGLRCDGPVLTGFRRASGVWTPILQAVDSTVLTPGQMGLELGDTTVRGDNYGGGSIGVRRVPVVAGQVVMRAATR